MPLDYLVDHARRRVCTTGTEPVLVEEICDVMDRQARDGAWAYGVRYDAREVLTARSTPDLNRIVTHAQRVSAVHGPRGPVAVIVSSQVIYGMSRMYAALSERAGQHVHVFRSVRDADQWLDACAGGVEPASPQRNDR